MKKKSSQAAPECARATTDGQSLHTHRSQGAGNEFVNSGNYVCARALTPGKYTGARRAQYGSNATLTRQVQASKQRQAGMQN